jgi:hypothetical protein
LFSFWDGVEKVNATSDLESLFLEGIPSLYRAAHVGDAHAATIALRRIIGRLRQINPALADQIKSRTPAVLGESIRSAATPISIAPRDSDSNLGLLRQISIERVLRPIMQPDINAAFDEFVREHRSVERLAEQGLTPRSTMLLVGPPGVGKTMASAWLASELGLPLFQVELPALISSYLGKTGQNLRGIFDFARSNSVVLLMDEFDAVAKRRDDPADLGEVRRVVSVLLKEIEEWPGPSVIVAATNFAKSLDRAVIRRFQTVLTIEPPGVSEATSMLSMHLAAVSLSADVLRLSGEVLAGASGSDIRNVAVETRRSLALADNVTSDEAVLRVLASRANTIAMRRKFTRIAHRHLRSSSLTRLSNLLGVSRTTVHSYLKESTNAE